MIWQANTLDIDFQTHPGRDTRKSVVQKIWPSHNTPKYLLKIRCWKAQWQILIKTGNDSDSYFSYCTLCFKPGNVYLAWPKYSPFHVENCGSTLNSVVVQNIFYSHDEYKCLISTWCLGRWLSSGLGFDTTINESSKYKSTEVKLPSSLPCWADQFFKFRRSFCLSASWLQKVLTEREGKRKAHFLIIEKKISWFREFIKPKPFLI